MNRELWDESPSVESFSPPAGGLLGLDWPLLATGASALVLFFGSFLVVLAW
jgi:hypothetical protein